MRTILFLSLLFLTACGDPVISAPKTNPEPDMSTEDQTTTPDVSTQACGPIQDSFKASVRALGRSCFENSDCQLADRAGPCDCAIGIGPGEQTKADFDSAIQSFTDKRALMDQNQCRNPFTCAGDKCPNYNVLSTTGELVPRCRGGKCEVTQLPSCVDYEAKKTGGLISKSECDTNADCKLRSDLNPCSCPEPVNDSFPALTGSVIREIIDINNARCGTTCEGCPDAQSLECVQDGARKVCALTN